MELKKKLEEYTEQEYLTLITAIFDGKYSSESEHDEIVNNIIITSEHPDGTDIIYYPADNVEDSPKGVIQAIKYWRAKNGKPGFKQG